MNDDDTQELPDIRHLVNALSTDYPPAPSAIQQAQHWAQNNGGIMPAHVLKAAVLELAAQNERLERQLRLAKASADSSDVQCQLEHENAALLYKTLAKHAPDAYQEIKGQLNTVGERDKAHAITFRRIEAAWAAARTWKRAARRWRSAAMLLDGVFLERDTFMSVFIAGLDNEDTDGA